MKLLRDEEFQRILVKYPRKRDTFLVAIGTTDTVSAEWLLRDGAGRELKPGDYLAMFARFVQENPAQIDAIRILLDRPREWSTAALAELRDKLKQTRQRFTPELLQKAHEAHYHKALVDIISHGQARGSRHRAPADSAGARRPGIRQAHGRQDVHARPAAAGWIASGRTLWRICPSTARISSCRRCWNVPAAGRRRIVHSKASSRSGCAR